MARLPLNLDDVVDTIGLAFPYPRRDVMAEPVTVIRRLHERALAHLERLYGRGIG